RLDRAARRTDRDRDRGRRRRPAARAPGPRPARPRSRERARAPAAPARRRRQLRARPARAARHGDPPLVPRGTRVMERFRVLIADDEPPALGKLRALFAREPDFAVACECTDGLEAERALAGERFDLALLDVQMPGRSGLDVVRAVGPARLPPVVFVTAFDEHAVRAFELHALDYLLKPYDRERFQLMLTRARREIGRASSAHTSRLEALLAELDRRCVPFVL